MKAAEIGHRSLALQWDPPSYTNSLPLTYNLSYKETKNLPQFNEPNTDSPSEILSFIGGLASTIQGIQEEETRFDKRLNLFRQDDNR